jgi:hypothetical protein
MDLTGKKNPRPLVEGLVSCKYFVQIILRTSTGSWNMLRLTI